MSKRPSKLIGLPIANFNALVKAGDELHLQNARLIPFYKPGTRLHLNI